MRNNIVDKNCISSSICNVISNIDIKKESFIVNEIDYNIDVAYEDDNYLYIFDIIAVVGETQNKNNRVYDWNTIKTGAEFYNEIINKYDYFRFMLDGHSDSDGYSSIAGIVLNQKIDDKNKMILIDVAIPKGTIIENIIRKTGIIGISMRMLAEDTRYISKIELDDKYNKKIKYIDDEIEAFVDNNKIEYISGNGKIIRYDIVNLPSFNQTFKKITKILPISQLKDNDKISILKYLPEFKLTKNESFNINENLIRVNNNVELDIVKNITEFFSDLLNILKIYKPSLNNISYIEFKNLIDRNNDIITKLYNHENFEFMLNNLNKNIIYMIRDKNINIDRFINEIILLMKNSVGLLQKITVNMLFDYIVYNMILYSKVVNNININKQLKYNKYNDDFSDVRYKFLIQLYSNDINTILSNMDDFVIFLNNVANLIKKHQDKYSYILTDYGCIIEILRFMYRFLFDMNNVNQDNEIQTTTLMMIEKWV